MLSTTDYINAFEKLLKVMKRDIEAAYDELVEEVVVCIRELEDTSVDNQTLNPNALTAYRSLTHASEYFEDLICTYKEELKIIRGIATAARDAKVIID